MSKIVPTTTRNIMKKTNSCIKSGETIDAIDENGLLENIFEQGLSCKKAYY